MRSAGIFAAFAALASLVAAAPTLTCLSRQYIDPTTNICKNCPSSMLTCSSATVAITCMRGRYITPDKQCVVPNACPQGTFPDVASTSCKKCYQVNAATCKDAGISSSTSCLAGSCLSAGKCSYNNRMAGGNYCLNGVMTSCGAGVSKCDMMTGAPTTCKTGYNLAADNTCVQCTGAQVWSIVSKKCEVLSCTTTAVVTFDRNNEEYILSTRAQYLDSASQSCKDCIDQYAQTCDSTGKATACLYDQFRWGLSTTGTCITCDRAANRFYNPDTHTCDLYCPGANFDWNTGAVTSVAQYNDPNNKDACLNCADPLAQRCDASGVTVFCVPGANQDSNGVCVQCSRDKQWDYNNKVCVNRCALTAVVQNDANGNFQYVRNRAQRYDSGSNQCINCNDQWALSCDATGVAAGCIAGWNLDSKNTCVQCVTGEVWEASTKTCKSSCPNADAQYTLDAGGRATTITHWAEYYHILYQVCYSCRDMYAQRCNYNGISTSCVPGATMNDQGSCVMILPTCDAHSTFNIARNRCEPTCGNAQYSNPTDPLRAQSPPQIRATYYSVDTNTCVACTDEYAYSCGTDGKATTCAPPKYKSDAGACIDVGSCPDYARASMVTPAGAAAAGFGDNFYACAQSFFGF